MKYCKKYGSDKVRVLSLVKNRGKGGAVRMVINTFSLSLFELPVPKYAEGRAVLIYTMISIY